MYNLLLCKERGKHRLSWFLNFRPERVSVRRADLSREDINLRIFIFLEKFEGSLK